MSAKREDHSSTTSNAWSASLGFDPNCKRSPWKTVVSPWEWSGLTEVVRKMAHGSSSVPSPRADLTFAYGLCSIDKHNEHGLGRPRGTEIFPIGFKRRILP
jgi:hypothetical protein